MNSDIDRILNELYAIDGSLRGREEELRAAIRELIESRPEARMDEEFEKDLRARLLEAFPGKRAAASGAAAPGAAVPRGGRFRDFFASPAVRIGSTALAACLVAALFFRFGPLTRSGEEAVGTDVKAGAGQIAATAAPQGKAGAAAAKGAAASAAGQRTEALKPAPKGASVADKDDAAKAPADLRLADTARQAPPAPLAVAADELAAKKPEAELRRATGAAAALPSAPLSPPTSVAQSRDKKEKSAAANASPTIATTAGAFAAEAAPSEEAPAYKDLQALQSVDRDFNTEGYDAIVETSFAKTVEDPLSTFSIDVDTASYANVRRFIEGGSLPPPDAVRIEELINYFSYDYPDPQGDEPFGFSPELAACPWNAEHLLLRVGLQAKRIPADKLPPSNLVFLIDVSGSMEDDNKLPLVKESLKLLARGMRQQDRIAIAVYAGAAGLVLPSTQGSDIKRIEAAIDDLEAGGSTAGGEGILLAYETAKKSFMPKGNNRVIIATDGDFNVGASSDGDLVRIIEKKREEGVFLTVLGFGMGNYKDSKMQKLADSGNGNYAYVDSLSEAEKVLSRQMAGTLYAVAKDVKVQIEFNPAVVGEYRLVGYEKRALAARDFADDTKDAGELGAGSSVTALYEIVPSKGASARTDLKYQSAAAAPASSSGELMTIKFRYKKPEGGASILREKPVKLEAAAIAKASDDFRFAAAVTEWGLLLRDSKYKGSATWKDVVKLAGGARGADEEGYRSEFLRLARLSETLAAKSR
jgi:Ca-activated chloride channel homolog